MNPPFFRNSRATLQALIAFLCAGQGISTVALGQVENRPVQLQTFKTHSRLSFRLDEGVTGEVKDLPGGFEIHFKDIGLADLGAPLGSEREWVKTQIGLADSRLSSLNIEEVAGGLKVSGKWRFASGAQAQANPVMERFHYRNSVSSQFVLDFWPKSGPSAAHAKSEKDRKDRAEAIRKLEERARRHQERKLAQEKARLEADDIERFCREPLAESKDVFLAFSPVHEKVDFTRWISVRDPDSTHEYHEPKGPEKDAQFVRLALDLYRQGKHALVLRTLDFFDAEQPKSAHRHEMQFLRANAQLKLGMEEQGLARLKTLVADARKTSASLHAAMFMAVRASEKDAHLATLEHWLWLINHHPNHQLNWVFHLGAAEALYALRQTDRATKEYQWVAINAPDEVAKAEAALRVGDLHLERRNYEEALAAYYRGLERFKKEGTTFASVHINRAESLYWLGQFDRAIDAFTSFLADFPGHPAGWRATYRLGDILARQEGDKARAQSRKWFYDTINRYPYSAGAPLARMRLLPCDDHGGMNVASARRFFRKEGREFTGSGEIAMDRYSEYRALSEIRTWVKMGLRKDAIRAAIHELSGGLRNPDLRDQVGDQLETLFRQEVGAALNAGKPLEALAFYRKHVDSIPPRKKDAELIDPDYLLKLSRAASDLGLGSLARELTAKYEKVHKGRQGRVLAEQNKDGDLDAKLKEAERAFTQAKALWISAGLSAKDKIADFLEKVIDESEHAYGREIILGLMDEAAEKPASALAHALRAQLLVPPAMKTAGAIGATNPAEQARINAWVAALQQRNGDDSSALTVFHNLENYRLSLKEKESAGRAGLAETLGVPALPELEALIAAQGEIHAKQGRWGEAASVYARAVEGGVGGNHVFYEYARALGKSGAQAKARETLETLAKSEKDDFWRKLAREALENDRSIAKEGKR